MVVERLLYNSSALQRVWLRTDACVYPAGVEMFEQNSHARRSTGWTTKKDREERHGVLFD